ANRGRPQTVNEPDASILTLDSVAVGYDRHAVLSGVRLAFKRGSFTGLLGANGSGKSTLIKTILGIIPPLAGRLEFRPVDGHEAGVPPARRADIGHRRDGEAVDYGIAPAHPSGATADDSHGQPRSAGGAAVRATRCLAARRENPGGPARRTALSRQDGSRP